MAYIRIYLKETLKQQVELDRERLTIGRAQDNDLVINDPGVSSHHAELVRDHSGYEIVDLGSTNGVFVNGKRVERQSLNYWDEIQVFNHVLKYMASAGLEDEQDIGANDSKEAESDATMEVDVSNIDDLARLRQRKKEVYLTLVQDPSVNHPVKKVNFTIGKGAKCDLPLKGFFAPRLAATIQHRSDGFYLLPRRWVSTRVNGNSVREPVRLSDGDRLQLRGRELTFFNRVPGE